jgi:hypothetical protein
MSDIPHCLTTPEVKDLLKVNSYSGLNAILRKHDIKPVWRGKEGNVYRGSDFKRMLDLDSEEVEIIV